MAILELAAAVFLVTVIFQVVAYFLGRKRTGHEMPPDAMEGILRANAARKAREEGPKPAPPRPGSQV